MGAQSKRATRIASAKDFDVARLSQRLMMPRDGQNTVDAWSREMIQVARAEQMLGQFVLPSRMVEQFRTDDALAVAYQNRLAPQKCIPVRMRPAAGARGAKICDEAEASFGANGVSITPDTIADIHGTLVNHGVAFAAIAASVREDGSRVDMELHHWPIEYVRWDPVFRVFKARADPNTVQEGDLHNDDSDRSTFSEWGNQYGYVGGYWVPVVHGDGRWVIFKKHDLLPFRQEAAILPAALVWMRHAFGMGDWSRASKAHGTAKVVGELPAGVPLQVDGGLSPEAQAFITLMQALVSDESPAGIRPAGSKTEYVVNSSTAWQVFDELTSKAEKAAARIYLGTDGTLGTDGGAPGIDIEQLFGVASTIVRGDLECLTRGIDTGLIQPWTAINFGDSRLAPSREYLIPNADVENLKRNYAERNKAYTEALQTFANAGLTLAPEFISRLAEDYQVRVPVLAVAPAPVAPKSPPKPVTPATNQ
jgi:hypothetical protein